LTNSLKKSSVVNKIAELIGHHLGVDEKLVLDGIPFLELHSDFDSLTFIEIQLMLEEEYKFEFNRNAMDKGGKLPSNALELADVLIDHYDMFVNVKAEKEREKMNSANLEKISTKTTL
jgi:acyl carrier protein